MVGFSPDTLTNVVSDGQLHLVAGDSDLSDVEFNLAKATRREEVLSRQLEGELDDYDVVLMDLPPNKGLIAVNAVVMASDLVVPVRMTDPNSINGIVDLQEFLAELADVDWPRPITAVLRLDCQPRTRIYRVLDDALAGMQLPVVEPQIPSTTLVVQSVASGKPVVRFAPSSTPAVAYYDFAKQLVETVLPVAA